MGIRLDMNPDYLSLECIHGRGGIFAREGRVVGLACSRLIGVMVLGRWGTIYEACILYRSCAMLGRVGESCKSMSLQRPGALRR